MQQQRSKVLKRLSKKLFIKIYLLELFDRSVQIVRLKFSQDQKQTVVQIMEWN